MTPSPADTSVSTLADRTHPLGVDDPTFLVDRLHADCAPGQFVREITQNSNQGIESLVETGQKQAGEIVWDVDWSWFERTGVMKLCCIDTGIGMTGPEMVEYVNQLTKSSHVKSTTRNFGVGGKISAIPLNPEGIIYLSWENGHGSMVHLWRDPITGVYGLKQFQRPDGTFGFWLPVTDEAKPEQIGMHGTKVVFLGSSDTDDTMKAPSGLPFPKKWVLRYLNTRYFDFPPGVVVRAREGWHLPKGDQHNFLRVVTGMAPWLKQSAGSTGTVPITGAMVHWWILRDDVDLNSGHYPSPGLVGALFQNELYDLPGGRAAISRLQSFGIIFGHSRVVLFVEPQTQGDHRLTANTARTTLLLNGESLPWAEWAAEFRSKMPPELIALQEEVASKAGGEDNRQNILDRLKQVRDLFKFSRYRAAPNGKSFADPTSMIEGGGGGDNTGSTSPRGNGGTNRSSGKTNGPGNIYATFAAESGIPADEVAGGSYPTVKWIDAKDGTRTKGDLEDRAARYVPTANTIQANADFRVFTDMIDRWKERYDHVSGAEEVIKRAVREWFEQQLIEAVMSAKSLANSKQWTETDVQALWSDEALTAVVLPRYHIDKELKRRLGSELGSLNKDAA